MSLEKIILKGAQISLLALPFLAGCHALKKEEGKKKSDSLGDLTLIYRSQSIKGVNNVPLSIRDVPKHPDDDYANNSDVAPISDDTVTLYDRVGFDFRLGKKFYFDDKQDTSLNIGIGAEISANLGGFRRPNDRKDLIERNYTNAPGTDGRGYGAALTYYQVYTALGDDWNTFLFPKIVAELETEISQKNGIGIGLNLWPEQVWVENGWDRYDKFEKRESHKLADVLMGMAYVSLKWSDVEDSHFFNAALDIGVTTPLWKSVEGRGEEFDIDFKDMGIFIGLRRIF